MPNPLSDAADLVFSEIPPSKRIEADPQTILAIIQAVISALIQACPKSTPTDLANSARLASRPLFGIGVRAQIRREARRQAGYKGRLALAEPITDAIVAATPHATPDRLSGLRFEAFARPPD